MDLVGCFVNTLAMRARFRGDPTFRQFLGMARSTVLEAFEHQSVTWERVVESVQPERDQGSTPVFQVLFVVHNIPMPAAQLHDVTLTLKHMDNGTATFDLVMEIDTRTGRAAIEYNTDLFDAATIDRMIEHFQVLLRGIAKTADEPISRLPLLSEMERQQLLVDWNQTGAAYPLDRCLHGLFEEQAARRPASVAVVAGGQSLTYSQLDRAANRLACSLQKAAVRPDMKVAICAERSPAAVIGMLAVLKVGGAFVPLDPAYPAERLAFMLRDTDPQVLLTERRFADWFAGKFCSVMMLDDESSEAGTDEGPLASGSEAGPGNLAYVLYTSGSTGVPKGVMIEHRSICNQIRWRQAAFGLNQTDAVLHSTSLSFDPSVWEIFGPLSCGARIIIVPQQASCDGAVFKRFIVEHQVSVLQCVPSLLRSLLDQDALAGCTSLRHVFCGGEPLDAGLQERFFASVGVNLHHLYGLTETSIDTTFFTCSPKSQTGVAPIGQRIANTRVYILDNRLEPVPIGVPGELYVGGLSLARGYLNNPGLTADRFIPDPFSVEEGARLCRTGDRAKWRHDGIIEFVGRFDQQIKIRGHRIEPAEIEAALRRHPTVRDTVVAARPDSDHGDRLVAWIVPAEGMSPELKDMGAFLAKSLPRFMLPGRYVVVDALPLTPSGKVDIDALPDAENGGKGMDRPFVAPRTPQEQKLAGIWEELLGTGPISVTDNFFGLGGHSLLAVRLAARMSTLFGHDVRCQEVFERPTIEQLAEAVQVEKLTT